MILSICLSSSSSVPSLYIKFRTSHREDLRYLKTLGLIPQTIKPPNWPTPETTAQLLTRVNFLKSKGFSDTDFPRIAFLVPQLFSPDLDPAAYIEPVFDFLTNDLSASTQESCGLITKCPKILFSDVDYCLRPTLKFLKQLGVEKLNVPTTLNAHLLDTRVEKLKEKIKFLRSIGFTYQESSKICARLPAIFGYSVENNLRPKVEYLVEEMERSLEELDRFPQYFGFSLERRIAPRHLHLKQRNMEDGEDTCRDILAEVSDTSQQQQQSLSKRAQKKLLKQQKYEIKKAQKKALLKEHKKKAAEQKRKEWQEIPEEEREKLIEARKVLRKERMDQRFQEKEKMIDRLSKAKENGQKIVIDLEFSHLMSPNEIYSLCQQITYCYAVNGRSESPLHLCLTSCNGEMETQLQNIPGFDKWIVEKESGSYIEALDDHKSNLVYLTADSESVLDDVDPTKIYIVGGLVDRNRWKGITMNKARDQGIQTAKLPIGDYFKMSSSQVLTVNQVLEILLKFLETRDWKDSFFQVIPQRKRCGTDTRTDEEVDGKDDEK